MPFTAHFGEAAVAENERRAVSYEALLQQAARTAVEHYAEGLRDDMARFRLEHDATLAACQDVRTMIHRIYLLFGAWLVAAVLTIVAVALVR